MVRLSRLKVVTVLVRPAEVPSRLLKGRPIFYNATRVSPCATTVPAVVPLLQVT